MDKFILAVISSEHLFYLVCWGLIAWVLWFGLNKISVPEPWRKLAIGFLAIITISVIANVPLSIIGHPIIRW